jgi:hypothetical protein
MRVAFTVLLLASPLAARGQVATLPGPPQAPAIPQTPVQYTISAEPFLSDQEVLTNANLKTDAASLLQFFQERTVSAQDRQAMSALIPKLGADDFATREKAYAELLARGPRALAVLHQALKKETDSEIRGRAESLRKRIEGNDAGSVAAAAVRMLGKHKAAGAAEILLAYCPFANEEQVLAQIKSTLASLAASPGPAQTAALKSLTDKEAIIRQVAAVALLLADGKKHQALVRPLLKDPDATVRLHVALNLVPLQDKELVPALVGVLGELSRQEVWPAEEVLIQLAGAKVPQVSLGDDAASRKLCREEWEKWFKEHGTKLDMGKLGPPEPLLGYTLIVQQDNFGRPGGKGGPGGPGGPGGKRPKRSGSVGEVDENKNVLWQIRGLSQPVAAQVLSDDRVLIAEYQGQRVTERDLKGDIKWSKTLTYSPLAAQRLANGNTFIVTTQQLLEVDGDDNEVFTYPARTRERFFWAHKFRNGEIAFVTQNGTYTRLTSKTKKVLNSFSIGMSFSSRGPGTMFGAIDVLPGGGILVPRPDQGRVVEYSAEGKEVWAALVPYANAALRLSNGNTLVTCRDARQIVEVDRAGKEVWYHVTDRTPFQARRR